MSPRPLQVVVCEHWLAETRAALAAEGLEGVEALAYGCDCSRDAPSWRALVDRAAKPGAGVCVLGGVCAARGREGLGGGPGRFVARDQCLAWLGGETLVGRKLAAHAYLVTPGWLAHWRGHVERLGFDREGARAFFGEAASGLCLLDTGTEPGSAERLDELGDWLGLPRESVAVGLDHLRPALRAAVLEWRLGEARREVEAGRAAAERIADYAMAFEVLPLLGRCSGDDEVLARAFDLFESLFAPARSVCVTAPAGEPPRLVARPPLAEPERAECLARLAAFDRECEPTATGAGLCLKLPMPDGSLAVLEAEGVAVPANLERYLHVAGSLGRLLALALANARSTEGLERAEAELRASERTTLQSIGDAVIATDAAGRVRLMNPVAERLTGWTAREASGRALSEVFRVVNEETRQPVPNPLETALREGRVVGLANHTSLVARDGTERPIADSAAPIREREGAAPTGGVLVFRDQTREREAERAREVLSARVAEGNKLQALGTLAGGIAHDFNNLLAAVVGFAELGLDDEAATPLLRDRFFRILQAGQRGAGLVKQILSFARKDRAQPRPVELRPLVSETLALVRATLPATVEIRAALATAGPVVADPTQVHQVLMNLCTNAARAMSESGGVLDVALDDATLDEAGAREHPDLHPGRTSGSRCATRAAGSRPGAWRGSSSPSTRRGRPPRAAGSGSPSSTGSSPASEER